MSTVETTGLVILPAAAVSPVTNTPASQSEKVDLFAPEYILRTYFEYEQHQRLNIITDFNLWLLKPLLEGARNNRLDNKQTGQGATEEECRKLLPTIEQGIQYYSALKKENISTLVMSPATKPLLESAENTFKLMKAIFGGEDKFNQLPLFRLGREYVTVGTEYAGVRGYTIGGGWLSRYEERLRTGDYNPYDKQSSSPTPVKVEQVTAPIMRGFEERCERPFFVLKAVDTEDMKEYVQVFYSSHKTCAWLTEGEKIIDCNYLVNEYAKVNTTAIEQLQQFLQTGEHSKTKLRRTMSMKDLEQHKQAGTDDQYLESFNITKYKWKLVQPDMT